MPKPTSPARSGTFLALLAALVAAPSMAAAPDARPGGADRHVVGRQVISDHDPRATLTLPKDFRYLGEDRWMLIGFDDAELHLFVDANKSGEVRRLFWVQFEAYGADHPEAHHGYDSPRHAKIGGLDFYVDTWVRAPDADVEADSDRDHLEKMLVAHGLKRTPAMRYVRLVHLPDAAQRKELTIIYGEALAPGDPSVADLSPGGARADAWPAMSEALIQRALAQVELRAR